MNWLRESTASWAEWAFAKDDEPVVRTWRFQWFQERPATTSVHTYDEAGDSIPGVHLPLLLAAGIRR